MKRNVLIILVFALIGFTVYFKSLFNGFVWDDYEQIVLNYLIKTPGFIYYSLTGSTFNAGGALKLSGMYYKPMMSIFFGLNYHFWGLNPFGYHLIQLILHTANALLVFVLFNKMLQILGKKQSLFLSFVLAIIFLIHPVNVESVAYVSSTQEVLYTFFSLSLLNILLSGFLNNKNAVLKIVIPLIFMTAALFSKETGLISVLLSISLVYFFNKKLLKYIIISSVSTLFIYFFFRFIVAKIPVSFSGVMPIMNAGLPVRLLTLPKIFMHYFLLYLFPVNFSVSQHWLVREATLSDFYFPVLFMLAFIAVNAYLLFRYKSRLLFFACLWFWVPFLMITNIIPLDMTVADRWFYFPQIGLLFITALCLSLIFKNRTVLKAGKITGSKGIYVLMLAVVTTIIFIFSIRTYQRSQDWKNGLTLFSKDIKINHDSYDLEDNLGVELFRNNRLEEAKYHFEKAVRLSPDLGTPYNNLGAVYDRQKDYGRAENLYRKAIQIDNYYIANENLAFVLLKQNRLKEAFAQIENARKYFPINTRLMLTLSLAYYMNNDRQNAIRWAKTMYEFEPTPRNLEILNQMMNGKTVVLD